jgi:IS5 family transposase
MATGDDALRDALRDVHLALTRVDPDSPADALPHLRAAQVRLTTAIDEAMALAIVEHGASIRQAGALAGLSENSVPPRLAFTDALAPYSDGSGRVSARAVERARYDRERGLPPAAAAVPAPSRPPMAFRRRRPD